MASTEQGSTRRVVLHVGLHKTGTTFLQTVFETNRDVLAEQGIYYPGGPGEPAQRMASWDLRGRRSPGSKDQRQVGRLVPQRGKSAHPPVPSHLSALPLLGWDTLPRPRSYPAWLRQKVVRLPR